MTSKRPLSILLVACLYLAVGVAGFAAHFNELLAKDHAALGIEALEVLGLVAGVFLIRGANWARWLATGWIALHVLISALNSTREMAMHAIICMGIVWILFSADAERFFRSRVHPSST